MELFFAKGSANGVSVRAVTAKLTPDGVALFLGNEIKVLPAFPLEAIALEEFAVVGRTKEEALRGLALFAESRAMYYETRASYARKIRSAANGILTNHGQI